MSASSNPTMIQVSFISPSVTSPNIYKISLPNHGHIRLSHTFGSVGSGPNAVFNNPRVQTNSGSRGVHAQATEGASLLSKEQSLQNTTGLPPGIEVHVKREAEINSLNELIFKQNLKLQRLERDLLNRDSELSVLRKRCRMFDEVLRYKATLAKLTITMEQAEHNAVRDSLDVINTDPAPLMIRDVDVNIDSNHSTENGSLMEQVGKTFVQSEGQRTKTLAHIVSNGQMIPLLLLMYIYPVNQSCILVAVMWN
ncbi:unnamed protein product [Heterobilharzia americana]|nr:unnamed protein product [Heterobilharzia americana]